MHSLHLAHMVALRYALIVPLLDHLDLEVGQEVALDQLLCQLADVIWQSLHLNGALQVRQCMDCHLMCLEVTPFPQCGIWAGCPSDLW